MHLFLSVPRKLIMDGSIDLVIGGERLGRSEPSLGGIEGHDERELSIKL